MITLEQLRAISPQDFEDYIAKLLPKIGYNKVKLTPHTADSGYDIEAYKDNTKVLFECKRYSENNKVGSREVRIFADACRRLNAQKGIFITTNDFTKMVYQEQTTRKLNIEFWNGKELLRQIMNSKNIKAYCIQCKTPIKGYYKSFDWKENVANKPKISILKYGSEKMIKNIWNHIIYGQEEDLVPKNPRMCERCEFWYTCCSCEKEFDLRKMPIKKLSDLLKRKSYRIARKYETYHRNLCLDCYDKLQKRSAKKIIDFLSKKNYTFKKESERSEFIESLKVLSILGIIILITFILYGIGYLIDILT